MKGPKKAPTSDTAKNESGTFYMLTQTFSTGAKYKSPVVAFNHYMPDYTNVMAQGTDFKLWVELTPTSSQLHIHGYYSITDKVKYYKKIMPMFGRYGHYLIKKIDNLSKVIDYCSKDQLAMMEILKSCKVELPLVCRYHLPKTLKEIDLHEKNFYDGWDNDDHQGTLPNKTKEIILKSIAEQEPPAKDEMTVEETLALEKQLKEQDDYEHTYCSDYA